MEKHLRNFGFSDIKWTIENFLAATSKQKWVISSPKFTIHGKIDTDWRFCLKNNYINEEHTASVYLENMDSSINEPIWVTWKLFFPEDVGEDRTEEVQFDFIRSNAIAVELSDADELQRIMQLKDVDKLEFRSFIFVSMKDSQVHKRSKIPGLKSLSQDMTALYRTDENYDVYFDIGGISGKAHSFILKSRSTVLKKLIETPEEVQLPELDPAAATSIFGYLYTGNLDHILRKPTFQKLEWIKFLKLKQLEQYYEPDYVEILSECQREVSSLKFNLPVEKIADSIEIVSLPSFENFSNLSTGNFNLILYPNGVTNEDYMSVCIKNTVENYTNIYQAEIGVIDSQGNTRYLERKHFCDFYEGIGFEEFLPRDSLHDSTLTWNGSLHIVCTLYSSDTPKEILTLITNDVVYYDIHIHQEEHYKMLSFHMALMFETGSYSDFSLMSEGEIFPVNSLILSARSHIFRDLFQDDYVNRFESVEFNGIRSNILKTVLLYMYSGRLLYYDINDLIDIYIVAAHIFFVLPLKYECSRLIEENLESLNIENALALANEFKDYKLISSIEKFIIRENSDNEENVY